MAPDMAPKAHCWAFRNVLQLLPLTLACYATRALNPKGGAFRHYGGGATQRRWQPLTFAASEKVQHPVALDRIAIRALATHAWRAAIPPKIVLRQIIQQPIEPHMLMILELPVFANFEVISQNGLLSSEKQDVAGIDLNDVIQGCDFISVHPQSDETGIGGVTTERQHVDDGSGR